MLGGSSPTKPHGFFCLAALAPLRWRGERSILQLSFNLQDSFLFFSQIAAIVCNEVVLTWLTSSKTIGKASPLQRPPFDDRDSGTWRMWPVQNPFRFLSCLSRCGSPFDGPVVNQCGQACCLSAIHFIRLHPSTKVPAVSSASQPSCQPKTCSNLRGEGQ